MIHDYESIKSKLLTRNSIQAVNMLKIVLLFLFASENSAMIFLTKITDPRSPSPYEMELAM